MSLSWIPNKEDKKLNFLFSVHMMLSNTNMTEADRGGHFRHDPLRSRLLTTYPFLHKV